MCGSFRGNRFRVRNRDANQRVTQAHHLAGSDLAPLAQFHLPIDFDIAFADQRAARTAAACQPAQLQQLIELDELGGDRIFNGVHRV